MKWRGKLQCTQECSAKEVRKIRGLQRLENDEGGAPLNCGTQKDRRFIFFATEAQ
jgi:hypothetical protein